MPRLPEITSRDQVPPEKQHIFDEITASRGRVGGPFAMLLHSPEVAGRIAHLGTYLRFESVLPAAQRELAICNVAREYGCALEWAAHVQQAIKEGAREEAIDIIGHRRPIDQLTEEEALPVRYGLELMRNHRVSDATFNAARARYGDQGVTDLTALVGFYSMISCVLNAFEVPGPADGHPLP